MERTFLRIFAAIWGFSSILSSRHGPMISERQEKSPGYAEAPVSPIEFDLEPIVSSG